MYQQPWVGARQQRTGSELSKWFHLSSVALTTVAWVTISELLMPLTSCHETTSLLV